MEVEGRVPMQLMYHEQDETIGREANWMRREVNRTRLRNGRDGMRPVAFQDSPESTG
jgi:hypothetical protein